MQLLQPPGADNVNFTAAKVNFVASTTVVAAVVNADALVPSMIPGKKRGGRK